MRAFLELHSPIRYFFMAKKSVIKSGEKLESRVKVNSNKSGK